MTAEVSRIFETSSQQAGSQHSGMEETPGQDVTVLQSPPQKRSRRWVVQIFRSLWVMPSTCKEREGGDKESKSDDKNDKDYKCAKRHG